MREHFLEQAGNRASEVGDPQVLSELLDRMLKTAVDTWPDLALPRATFAAALGARFGAASSPLPVWFERLHPADLYLAVAVTEGVSGAVDAFESCYRADIARAGRRYEGPRHPAEDLVQIILEKLLVGGVGKPPKLAEYAGQGHLQNWLRVASARTALDAVKGGAQHKREQGTDDLAAAADVAGDVELDFIKSTYHASFKESFAEAVAGLQPEERTLLRMSAMHNLGIDEIGAVLHIHRATAARRLARAREELLAATRRSLCARLKVRDDEIDSVLGLIGSRMEVSLERLLRTTRG